MREPQPVLSIMYRLDGCKHCSEKEMGIHPRHHWKKIVNQKKCQLSMTISIQTTYNCEKNLTQQDGTQT